MGLPQVGAVSGTIQRHFALLSTTRGADAPVDGGTETLFLALLADGAAHVAIVAGIERWSAREKKRPAVAGR